MSERNIISTKTVDGIKITTYDDGSLHFDLINQDINQKEEKENKSWWQKLKDWWNNSPITPYVKIRDLANPFNDRTDIDAGSDGKNGIEAGIRIKF